MASVSITNISKAIYSALYDKTGNDLDFMTSNVVKILSKKGMLSKSDSILDSLSNLIDHDNKIIRAKLYSVNKLEKQTIEKIEQELKDRYKIQKVYITEIEDKSILGGIKIEIDDEIIDLSLLKKVTQLKKHLLN
jgi:F-type H+-transporting ATPase subunit delta